MLIVRGAELPVLPPKSVAETTMSLATVCVPSTEGTGASTFQPLVTEVSGTMAIGAPLPRVADTCDTPDSASTTTARIGMTTVELTSNVVPAAGDVIVTV